MNMLCGVLFYMCLIGFRNFHSVTSQSKYSMIIFDSCAKFEALETKRNHLLVSHPVTSYTVNPIIL